MKNKTGKVQAKMTGQKSKMIIEHQDENDVSDVDVTDNDDVGSNMDEDDASNHNEDSEDDGNKDSDVNDFDDGEDDVDDDSDGSELVNEDEVLETKKQHPAKRKLKTDSKQRSDKADKSDQPVKKKIKKSAQAEKVNEISQMKEAEDLFHSSLFKMQIKELLSEVVVQDKRRKSIDDYRKKITKYLLSLPDGKEYDVTDQSWVAEKNVKVPLVQSPFKVKGKFQFRAPQTVTVVGSFSSKTCLKPNVRVDLAVEIPKECIQAKDYMNQRYLRKRALYLTHIADQLNDSALVKDVKFAYHHGNHMRPVIIVSPEGNHTSFQVCIHTTLQRDIFKLNRFHINKNNVRTSWFQGTEADLSKGETSSSNPPTPKYNTTMLTDMCMVQHSEFINKMINGSSSVKEGVALLRVWLHQRELDQGYGGFSNFIISMYVCSLILQKKLNTAMSSYHIMRNTLLQLAKADWCTHGINLADDLHLVDSQRPSMDDFHKAFDVVFVDPTGYLNICANMSKNMFKRVQHEASLAISFLEDPTLDSFEILFMTHVPMLKKFDHVFHISDLRSLKKSVTKLNLTNELLDNCGNYVQIVVPRLLDLIQRALGSRAALIMTAPLQYSEWFSKSQPPFCAGVNKLSIGILLNPEGSTSVLDKGPPANTPEAAEFREFWGGKSDLRRFQDGSICEAVVWPSKSLAERRLVCGKIVKYILNRHADVTDNMIHWSGGQLDRLLCVPQPSNSSIVYGTGEETHLSIIRSYDNLCKQLRGLHDLPLAINSISGTDAVFRFAEVFPPMPAPLKSTNKFQQHMQLPVADQPCPTWVKAMEVICVLEGSGKWPEDKDAFQRLKTALLIQVGTLLRKEYSLVTSINVQYVDVLKDGYVFRLRLATTREIAVLKMHRSPEGLLQMKDTEESKRLERDIVMMPKLTSALFSIQQQHSTYSSVVRLAKRWVSSQLLGDHIPEVAVELVVANLYISPGPFTLPSSSAVGFLRFLSFLSTHDWNTSPLIVNLNKEFTKNDYTEIQSKFTKQRSTFPVMCIVTSYDKFGSVWTLNHPTPQMLNRLVTLAAYSLQVIENQTKPLQKDVPDLKEIFRPPLDAYDGTIHLNHKLLSRQYHAVDLTDKTFVPLHTEHSGDSKMETLPVINFDPVLFYLDELRSTYDELALFFHDALGGEEIGVVWKPKAFEPQNFRVSNICARIPDSSSDQEKVRMIPNMEAVLEDFKMLGDDLVTHVEINLPEKHTVKKRNGLKKSKKKKKKHLLTVT